MQHKSISCLTELTDIWDANVIWDAFLIQEVVHTSPQTSTATPSCPVVLQGLGRGGHTAIVSAAGRGRHSVAVVIHNRWIKYISHHADLGRVLMVELHLPLSSGDRRLQLISAHLPSSIGSRPEEVEESIRLLGHATAETGRRTSRVLGMDANARLDKSCSFVVGQALEKRDAAYRASQLAHDLASELEGMGMTAMDTFSKFWDPPGHVNLDVARQRLKAQTLGKGISSGQNRQTPWTTWPSTEPRRTERSGFS